jgi:hypothetical protein
VEDGGRPPGIGFQERVPNHSKRLRSKIRGRERWKQHVLDDVTQMKDLAFCTGQCDRRRAEGRLIRCVGDPKALDAEDAELKIARADIFCDEIS